MQTTRTKPQQENPTTRCSQTNTQTSRQHASIQLTPQPPLNTQCKTTTRKSKHSAHGHISSSAQFRGCGEERGRQLRRHTNPGLLRQGPPPAAAKFQAWPSSAHASRHAEGSFPIVLSSRSAMRPMTPTVKLLPTMPPYFVRVVPEGQLRRPSGMPWSASISSINRCLFRLATHTPPHLQSQR